MTQLLAFLVALARRLLHALADTLAPPRCAACDARLSGPAVFCRACAATVERSRGAGIFRRTRDASPAPSIVAFAIFGGAMSVALHRLKYGARPDLAAPLGQLARRAARESALVADLVVPVPLHARRLAERGYNQAALLAAEIADELGAPLAARALVRVRDTAHQARLGQAARAGNVAEAFRARSAAEVAGRRIVLVDDVATTGATLAACAAPLLAAGAVSVTALVVARALAHGEEP